MKTGKKRICIILLLLLPLLLSFSVHAENECEILAAGDCAPVYAVPAGSTGEIPLYSSECTTEEGFCGQERVGDDALSDTNCKCYCSQPFYPGEEECEYRGYRCIESSTGPLRTESDPLTGYRPIQSEGTIMGEEYSATRGTKWNYNPDVTTALSACEWHCAQGYVREGKTCVRNVIPRGINSCADVGGDGCLSFARSEEGAFRLDEGDIWCNAANPPSGGPEEYVCVLCSTGYEWVNDGLGTSTGFCRSTAGSLCTGSPPSTTTGTIINDGTNSALKVSARYSFEWTYTSESFVGPCRWSCETGYRKEGNGCFEDCETTGACNSETRICSGNWCTPEGQICPAGWKWDSLFGKCTQAAECGSPSKCPYSPLQPKFWITQGCFQGSNPRTHACCPVNFGGVDTTDYTHIETY